MSAIQAAPRSAPQPAGRSGAGRGTVESLRILIRLTLLELRRSPMPLILPPAAALFWFDALRTGGTLPAIWTQRASVLPDHLMPDLGPVTAGMAAWVAGREQRRGMGDLAESTARPRWLRQLACWGGTLGWTLLAYAAGTTTIYLLAARAGSWGPVPVWPIVVTGAAVAAFCTTGFVAGAVFPSRFTAPLAALGTMFASVFVFQSAVGADSGWALISPNNSVPQLGWGVFRPVAPDLAIVQTGFLLGGVVFLLGVLGLRGSQLRRSAIAVTGVGVVACVAGLALAATATRGDHGYAVPLLHDAASDRPTPFTPDCSQETAIAVCLHPAFAPDLPAASAAFAPLIATVSGLPGAPARVTQIDFPDLPRPSTADQHVSGPGYDQSGARNVLTTGSDGAEVLEFGFGDSSTLTDPGTLGRLRGQAAQDVIGHIVAPGGRPDAAQQAVELALMQKASASQGPTTTAPDPGVAAAAQRFAALDSVAARAWLIAHLDQLHAGTIALGDLP
jgi:hypothetical protein